MMSTKGDVGSFLKDQYERVGNSPAYWKAQADHLLVAGRVLEQAWGKAEHQVRECFFRGRIDDCPIPEETRVIFAMLLLRGYAVECLMKAIWLYKREKLVENGEYVGPSHHKLWELARNFGLLDPPKPLFNQEQQEVLKRLGQYTEFLGRYHVPRNAEEYIKQQKGAMGWSSRCDEIFKQIMDILQDEIEKLE